MNKPEIKTVQLTLANGTASIDEFIDINPGEQIFAAATSKGTHNKLIRLGLYVNNDEVHAPLSLGFWDGQIGTFQQRGRLLAHKGGSKFQIKVTTSANVTEAIEIEVAFEIWKQSNVAIGADGTIIHGVSC